MPTLYGATLFNAPTNGVNFNYDIIGSNSEVFAVGDPVTIESGFAEVAEEGDQVYGVCVKAATMASNNQTVGLVKVPVIPLDQDYVFLMTGDADFTKYTDIGKYFAFTGTTGAVLVDVDTGSTTPTGLNVLVTAIDPHGLGGTGAGSGIRQALVKFVSVENIKSKT